MTTAQSLLKALVEASEGTRKQGFTVGGVSFQLNQAQDTVTGTFTIPVGISTDSNGKLIVDAKDFLELASDPAQA